MDRLNYIQLTPSISALKHCVLILTLILFMPACEKGFEELNENPNTNAGVASEELFANAQFKYHTDYLNGVLTEIWGLNTWMQVQANINGIASVNDAYFLSGDATNNTWRVMYAEVLGNVDEAMRLTEGIPSEVNKHSIYRIYRAYIFHRLTDLWGNIPYSQAFNVINDNNEPDYTPAYDGQESIYLSLLSELEAAAEALDPDRASLGAQDWFYQGDVERWRRFANSLRLRMAMRMSDVAPGMAQEVIEELVAADDFISFNDQNAGFPHSGAARSPFYELDNTAQGMYNPSHYLLEMLDSDEDPRIERYADHSPESVLFGTFQYIGIESFLLSDEIDPNTLNTFTTSYINEYFLDASLKSNTFSAAETHFLLAEAALQGMAPGTDPQTHYEAGVRYHMQSMDIDEADIDEYLSGNGKLRCFSRTDHHREVEDLCLYRCDRTLLRMEKNRLPYS